MYWCGSAGVCVAFAMLYLTHSEPSLRLCHPIAQGYRKPSRRNAAYL